MEQVKKIRKQEQLLTMNEMEALLGACKHNIWGERDKALLVVMWRTGLRVSEATHIQIGDIDADHHMLTVTRGKGRKRRVVGLDEKTWKILQDWLHMRGKWLIKLQVESDYVFCTYSGQPVIPRHVHRRMQQLAKKARVFKRVHPHGLRHLCAASMIMEGITLDLIRDVLGHSNIAITDAYLQRLAPARVIKAMHNRTW